MPWLCKWGEKHISSIITQWYTKQKLSFLWPHTFHRTMKTLYSGASPWKVERSRTQFHGAMAFTSWLLNDFSDSLFRRWIYYMVDRTSSSLWPQRVQSNSLLTVSNGIQYLERFMATWKIMKARIAATSSLVMNHWLKYKSCDGVRRGTMARFRLSREVPALTVIYFFFFSCLTKCRTLIELH